MATTKEVWNAREHYIDFEKQSATIEIQKEYKCPECHHSGPVTVLHTGATQHFKCFICNTELEIKGDSE